MQGQFIQFIAYTMAMVGFLSVCLLTYKKLCVQTSNGKNGDCLCIENALRLNPKKQIFIVRAGNERFLVASDSETTTMLAKLEDRDSLQDTNTDLGNIEKMISMDNFKQKKSSINNMSEIPAFKRITKKIKA